MTTGNEQKLAGSPNCAKCGACSAVCPVYRVTGRESLTARGRLHLLERLTRPLHSQTFEEIFSKCLLCGACAAACPRGIDITTLTIRTRRGIRPRPGITFLKKWLTRQALARPALLQIAGRALGQIDKASRLLPVNSGLRLRIPEIPELTPGRGYISGQRKPAAPPQALYFTGCLANYLSPAIARASSRLMQRLSGRELYAPPQQGCCGIAALSAGDLEQAVKLARQNIRACGSAKWRTLPIFTSCASCYAQLKYYPRLLANDKKWAGRADDFAARVQEFSSYLLEHGSQAQRPPEAGRQRVVYHDPCHLRFGPRSPGNKP
ncbi:MAG: (Fe-S)-binding protein [Deltaproteobacteria bacterium]|nr:(Fe-S)-binding protein [Deltaproteobacteria bacterium]